MRFYINRTGNAEGPHDEATIVGMIQRGEFSQGHICVEGGQAWQPLNSHPPFANALAGGGAQVNAAAHQVAAGFGQAANAFGQAVHQATAPAQPQQPQFGQPQHSPQPQAPIVTAPSAAAPGQGFFEQAKNSGAPISEEAKAAAGNAFLFSGAGAFATCGFAGGVVGAFVSNVLYKEQPKSPFTLFHVNQALVMHGIVFVLNLVTWPIIVVVGGIIATILANIATPLALLTYLCYLLPLALWLGAIGLSLMTMGKAKRGEWAELPLVGKRVMGLKSPILK